MNRICMYFALFSGLSLTESTTIDLGELDCESILNECPLNNTCKGHCNDSCARNEVNIWGTEIYPYFSPICKSAAHDFRISVWNTTERVFLLKRVEDNGVYQGSIRKRISSGSYSLSPAKVSSYAFLNPYISENIADIASIHRGYLFGANEDHVQECLVASNHQSLNFKTYIGKNNGKRIGNETNAGDFTSIKILWSGQRNLLPENSRKLNAGFQCILENNTLSILTSLAFRKDAEFYPINFTVTVNVNETVTLNMIEQTTQEEYGTEWKKDSKKKYMALQNVSRTSVTLMNTEISYSGIYSLEYKDNDPERRGYMRLIVRACPYGKYGSFCEKECPHCYNGGVCHDITGVCICAPGFRGTTCEEVCVVGSFGSNCSMKCSLSSEQQELSCKGLLICLPDPYGCSCAAGFTGVFCNETCLPGTYGAGCSERRDCHCANEENCNIYSGSCNGSCADGWHGKYCSDMPVNVTNLSFKLIPSLSVNLTWEEPIRVFSAVEYYIVTYQQIGWRNRCNFPVDDKLIEKNTTKLFAVWKNLEPFAVYKMCVTAVTIIPGSALEAFVETNGEVPPPPSGFQLSYRTATALFLSWLPPFPSHGLLEYFEIKYRSIKNNTFTKIIINNSEARCGSQNNTHCCVIKHLMISQKYEIQLKAFNLNISKGSESVIIFSETSTSEPETDAEISILWQEDHKVAINISHRNKTSNITSGYFLVVYPEGKEHSTSHISKFTHRKSNCSGLTTQSYSYIVGKLHSIPEEGVNFTIGNNSCLSGYFNPPLENKKTYRFGIASLVSYCGENIYGPMLYAHETVTIDVPSSSSASSLNIILGFLLPLIVIIGIVIFIAVLFFLQKFKSFNSFELRRRFLSRKAISLVENDFAVCNEALDEFDIIETESICDDLSNCLPVKELNDFVKQNGKNHKIRREFMSLPKGQIYPCSAAKMPENKLKNRYGNILPYDHTRVELNENSSIYVHANYIDGYKKARKFIATQGPMPHTINDFWSMVWKEKASKIIMITNLVENRKSKCEKYWTEEVNSYGSIELSYKDSESFADFIVRKFNISKGQKNKELKQFHFTSWPDHGVPLNTTPFLNFLKKVEEYDPNCNEPIIVHCSAGVGRTGAIILFHNAFNMGLQEGQVDVLGHLCTMRKQRMNIVENYDQYMFVYHALVEALCTEKTNMCCTNFVKQYHQLQELDEETGISGIEKQFKILNGLPVMLLPSDILAAYMASNQAKNRSMHILPSERARPILQKKSSDSDYINAVYIDGYRHKNKFVATQHPLPETVVDFWRMVYELKSRIIVLLQDIPFSSSENPQLWPLHGTQRFEEFQVGCESVIEENDVVISNLTLTLWESMGEIPPVSVRVLQIKTWLPESNLPPDISTLVSAIKFIQLWQNDSTNCVVIMTCLDGVSACGVFSAFLYIVDRMKSDKEIDIFQTVKCIRTNRTQFIVNLDQYKFLFDLTKTYLENIL